MIDQKDVTIIMPHLGATQTQCNAFKETLTSLHETVPDIRIIVTKNGSVGCTCDRDIRIIEQGQCKAVNAAVAITNTPWVFITNDDMIYAPGWWEKLTSGGGGTRGIGFDDPQVFCISPKLVEPRPGAPTFDTYFCGGAGGDFDKQKWLDFAKDYHEQAFPFRTGFNFPVLIKREVWETIQAYDINYDPFGSNGDSDLEYKIKLAGIQPYQNTNCIVYHFGQTSGTFHPDNRSYWEKNWHYFIAKWGFERASSPTIWTADFIIPTVKEGRKFIPLWENKYDKKTD